MDLFPEGSVLYVSHKEAFESVLYGYKKKNLFR
jgi:hypothetical protein